MTKIISHRGNLDGPDPKNENRPEQIEKVIQLGFDVEVDVWKIGEKWFLGHDEPQYEIDLDFLLDNDWELWCHAKNLEALIALNENSLCCFWHQNDDYTLTSDNHIWTYPGKAPSKESIILLFEKDMEIPGECKGICVDHVTHYFEKIKLKTSKT